MAPTASIKNPYAKVVPKPAAPNLAKPKSPTKHLMQQKASAPLPNPKPPPPPPKKPPSYSVPVHGMAHRNIDTGHVSAINNSVCLFDERMAEVAKECDATPASFRQCVDAALTLTNPDDYLKEQMGLFIQSVLQIPHFKGNSATVHVTAETILKKIRNIALEFHYLMKKSGKQFKHDDEDMKEMYTNFTNRYGKNLEDPGGDEVASQKVKPLYGALVPGNPRQMVGSVSSGSLTVAVPSLDLKTVVDRLMMSNKMDDFGVLLMLVLTRLAVGRAGENKYLSYSVMTFDPMFHVLLARWFMPKQLKIALATFCMDFKYFQLCPFCAFAFFWMKGGLQRGSNDAESSYVFPTLRATHGGRCAVLETSAIRECIVDEDEKKQNSSKSLRVGGTSHLQADPQVTDTETNAAGGWTEYTNMRFYTRQSLALLLAPARSLAHWFNPREPHFVPSFDSLSVDEHTQVQVLLEQLFLPNDVPELQRNNGKPPKHHAFMLVVSATLIMRYPEIRDYNTYHLSGGSPIIHRIIHVAMEAWNFQSSKTADDRLQLLSDKIRANFMQKIHGRRMEHPDAVEQTESLLTRLGDIVVANQTTTLRSSDDVARLEHQVVGLEHQVVGLRNDVQTLNGTVRNLMEMLTNNQRQQNQALSSPVRTVVGVQSISPASPVTAPPPAAERASLEMANDNRTLPDHGNNVEVPETPQQDAFQLMMGTEVGKSRGLLPSNASVQNDDMVSDFLIKLYQQKKLLGVHDGCAMDGLSTYFSNKKAQHKAKHALLLVDCLFMSKEERMRFTACNVHDKAETKEAEKFFREMNERCKKATAYLEEKKEVSAQRRPNVSGIGNVVNKKKDQLELWKPSWVAADTSAKPVEKLVYPDSPPNAGETFAAFLERFFNNKKRKLFKR
jgi:lipopolysaccharide export system protein LptC